MARALVYLLFGATVLGGLGLLGSALAVEAMGARLLGIALYAAAPGFAGWWLTRRLHSGGRGVWIGLIAVQVWLIAGGIGNLADGSGHGFTQLFLPAMVLLFLTRAESRDWFRLPLRGREEKPDFSLAHMLTWRRDRGQSALEYTGLIAVVVAIILALVLGGVGGRISDGLQSAICSLTGSSCPVTGEGGDTVQAGQDPNPAAGGTDGSATGGTGGGSAGSGGSTGGSTGGTGSGSAGAGGSTDVGGARGTGGASGGSTGGAGGVSTGAGGSTGSSTGGAEGGSAAAGGSTSGATTGTEGGTGGNPGGPGGDTYPETHEEPEAAYDVPVSDTDESEEGDEGGGGKVDEEDCGGWGFFGCAWDRGTQVVKGVFVDGVWGDLTGIADLFKPETWSGMADYGKQLGDTWAKDSKDAGDKWDKGDYLGALGDWGKASVNTVVKVGDDVFVGDEVRERWNNGQKTRAVTDVAWNVGSLFIPGYDVAKVVGKVGKLGKLGKVVEDVAEAAADAGDAARRARKAADAGDVEGARKAAKEAEEAADEAEEKARKTGCSIAFGPMPGYRVTGVAGMGTGVLAAGPPARVILADSGCDEEAKAKAAEARKHEMAAWVAKKRAEEPKRAAKVALKKKQPPAPKRNDTSDPRNYNAPDWAENLNDPPLGSADKGDGYWASRDRNPPPNWKNESWMRYQEQITGTVRNREYIVPHPKKGETQVEYDGWDSSRQTFLEAKNGYADHLTADKSRLTKTKAAEFVAEAERQVAAAGGRAVEWHFSDPDVAKAARQAFRDARLPVKVIYTKQKPKSGARKPEAFD